MPWTKVIVPTAFFRGFPQHCASCLSMENLQGYTAGAKRIFQDRLSFDVPICANCAKRDRWLSRALSLFLVLSLIGGRWIADHFDLTVWARDAITIVTFVFVHWAGRQKHPVSVSKKSGQDTVTFWMRNEQYAQEFATMNAAAYEEATFAPML